jgi:hypothetical protein
VIVGNGLSPGGTRTNCCPTCPKLPQSPIRAPALRLLCTFDHNWPTRSNATSLCIRCFYSVMQWYWTSDCSPALCLLAGCCGTLLVLTERRCSRGGPTAPTTAIGPDQGMSEGSMNESRHHYSFGSQTYSLETNVRVQV